MGLLGGLSNAEEGRLMHTRNAKGACFKRDKRSRQALGLLGGCQTLKRGD